MSDLLAHLAPSINVVPDLVTMLGHADNTITATDVSPCHGGVVLWVG